MSFVMIPEELLTVDISAAQLRALIHLINNTYSTGKFAGCCCLGYQNLAELCFTNKPVIIKTVQQLEQMGFVEINRRDKFNRSNAIKITIESGLERLRGSVQDFSGDTNQGYLKDTDKGYLKHTEGYLKDTEGYLKDTPHIDLKFKNLDLKNKKKRAGAEQGHQGYLKDTDNLPVEKNPINQIAPADDAAGRSMPERVTAHESAKEVQAENSEYQFEVELACQISEFKEVFKKNACWLNFFIINNQLAIRPAGKMGFEMVKDEVEHMIDWWDIHGQPVKILKQNEVFINEIKIA